MTRRQQISLLAKQTVAHVLYYSGLLRLWQRVVMRDRAVVLMYHRVLTRDEQARSGSHPALIVGDETFERQMAALKRWFTVLSVEEVATRLEGGRPLPSRSCVITFDDGWRDNFTNALPVLSKHQLPALVFLPISYIGARRTFWQEALTHLLVRAVEAIRQDPSRRGSISSALEGTGLEKILETADVDPRALVAASIGTQKRADRRDTEALIGDLARLLAVDLDELASIDGFVDWTTVREMARHGIAFGAHGVEHMLLTYIPAADAEREIRCSWELLKARLPEAVATFSYPNGYFNDDHVHAVQAAGYRLAFTTSRGFVTSATDPFRIPRLNVHEGATSTVPMFLARAVGLM